MRVWLGFVVVIVAVRLPVMATASGGHALERAPALIRGLGESAADRIARASAITPAFIAAVRDALPQDGRLVLFSPYTGAEFEFLLRSQFERSKNLLYPDPRDVHFARGADELRSKIAPAFERRLLVVDGTQQPIPLTIGGDYELLHGEHIGGAVNLRLWRLVKCH